MAGVDLAQPFLVGNNLFQGTLTILGHLGLIFRQIQGANSLQRLPLFLAEMVPRGECSASQAGARAPCLTAIAVHSSLFAPLLLTGVAPSLGPSALQPLLQSLTPHDVTTSSEPSVPPPPPRGTQELFWISGHPAGPRQT